MTEPRLIDNAKWLAGYKRFERGGPCPWEDGSGDTSARQGWIAAKYDADTKGSK